MAKVTGGAKFEAKLRELAAKVARPATLRVGFLEKSSYPDGTPVALIAAIQDFGAPSVGIPPRPFMRNMVAAKRGEWAPALAKLLKDNDYDAVVALDIMGAAVAGQIRQSIRDTNAPPLKPATIARKGFSKPLIETSMLINSVDHDIKT